MTIAALFLIFLVLILVGMPVAWALGLSSFTALLTQEAVPLTVIPQRLFTTLDSFSLIAIPLFMLTGVLMIETGMTVRIVECAKLVVGRLRGGFAQVNVMSSVMFSGVSGSASADVAATGSIMIPAMKREGYDPGFSVALTAAASTIGPIIPPSILMIIYGSMSGVSIGALFMAGILPGLLLALAFMVYCYYYATRHKIESTNVRSGVREVLLSLRDCAAVLVLPVVIIGGIRLGLFSASEAGAIAAAYALFLGLVTRTLKLRRLKKVLVDAAVLSTISLMIIATASAFGWLLAKERVPQLAIQALESITEQQIVALLVIVAGLLVIGMFLEASAALIILIPVLVGIQQAFGFDPIHFGLIVILTLVVGGITPPVGNLLFIAAGIGKVKLSEALPKVGGLVIVMIVVILIVVAVPWLATAFT